MHAGFHLVGVGDLSSCMVLVVCDSFHYFMCYSIGYKYNVPSPKSLRQIMPPFAIFLNKWKPGACAFGHVYKCVCLCTCMRSKPQNQTLCDV